MMDGTGLPVGVCRGNRLWFQADPNRKYAVRNLGLVTFATSQCNESSMIALFHTALVSGRQKKSDSLPVDEAVVRASPDLDLE